MVQIANNNLFETVSPKELMEATYKASENFQVRAFFEAKDDIIKAGKYSEDEFYSILDALIDAETERRIILDLLKGREPLFLHEIVEIIKDFPAKNVIRDVTYLKEQGYVDELIEIKTKMVIKKIKGEEKEVEEKEYFYRYQAKTAPDKVKEHYFEPVSIVFKSGACCQCGWCSSVCPVNAITVTADSLEVDEEICMKCGLCFSVCPRSFSIDQAYSAISKSTANLNFSEAMGAYINAYTATTTNDEIKNVRQDGGIVTSICEYLLVHNIVDAVIAVQHSKDLWRPEPIIVDDVKDLYKTGGTKYANSPSLTIIEKAKNYERIAVVGVPCMVKALFKGNLFPNGLPFFKNIKYTIGLFCMEAFSYDNIIQLAKDKFSQDINNLTKMNIDSGKFIINLKNGEEMAVELKEVQSYARDNCHFCEDLTSDYADISVGSIGSKAGYSSVITRSQKGDELFSEIIESGLVETQNLKETKPGFGLVERIARTKRNKCKPILLEKEK
jgi:coenzyme F420 hydrogenase subunit beta